MSAVICIWYIKQQVEKKCKWKRKKSLKNAKKESKLFANWNSVLFDFFVSLSLWWRVHVTYQEQTTELWSRTVTLRPKLSFTVRIF